MKKLFFIVIIFLSTPALATNYTITDLGTLGKAPSFCCGINENGEGVGDSYITGSSVFHAYIHNNSGIHDIGTLGGDFSTAFKIGNSGVAIGGATYSGETPLEPHAFVWDETNGMRDIGTLGGQMECCICY